MRPTMQVVNACLLTAGFAFSAHAEGPQSFTQLVGNGYIVSAVTLIPLDSAKRQNADAANDTVMVTLQKEKSVAVCYYNLSNWVRLNPTSLDNPSQCETR